MNFNSQPHKEADGRLAMDYVKISRNFNSQPHKEADQPLGLVADDIEISTHSLTRRLTYLVADITKMEAYFNSQPHKEADEK